MGIYRFLREGSLRLDAGLRHLEVIGVDGLVRHRFPYDELTSENLWWQVYEIFVGRSLEREGYAVSYRGATMGFLDGGVDLVAEKDGERLYLQCKHTWRRKKLTKKRIEELLFAASNYLHREYAGRRLEFRVVVPSLAVAFGGTLRRRKGRDEVDSLLLRYLLAKNDTQSKVRIDVLELPMLLESDQP